jgi:transposase
MNYNSTTKDYTKLKKFKTKLKRNAAKLMYWYGWEVKDIAKMFGLSKTRIYQYLKKNH